MTSKDLDQARNKLAYLRWLQYGEFWRKRQPANRYSMFDMPRGMQAEMMANTNPAYWTDPNYGWRMHETNLPLELFFKTFNAYSNVFSNGRVLVAIDNTSRIYRWVIFSIDALWGSIHRALVLLDLQLSEETIGRPYHYAMKFFARSSAAIKLVIITLFFTLSSHFGTLTPVLILFFSK